MAKERRAQWFKLFRHQKSLIDSVSDQVAGEALKACFAYFETGELKDMEPLTFAVFSAIRPYIDESLEDYRKSQEYGHKGSSERWGKEQEEA